LRRATFGTDEEAVDAIRCTPGRTNFVRWPMTWCSTVRSTYAEGAGDVGNVHGLLPSAADEAGGPSPGSPR
jgi:hypothetical protein